MTVRNRLMIRVVLLVVLTALALVSVSAQEMMAPGSGKIEFTTLETAQAFAAERPTVLFFHASWCPTCRAAMADIDARLDELDDIALLIVDYDTERALRRRYGVSYQHTFVQIDESGEAIAVWNGGKVDEILENTTR